MYIEYFGHIFMALYFFLKMIFLVETFIIYISMLIMKDCYSVYSYCARSRTYEKNFYYFFQQDLDSF